jgi:MYXO-CTERM domain-containing protein
VRSWCEEPGILPADYVVTDDSEPTGPGDTEDTEDSEPVVDTGSVSETGEGGGGGKGCGCDAPGAGPSVGLVVAGLLLALRRRTGSR